MQPETTTATIRRAAKRKTAFILIRMVWRGGIKTLAGSCWNCCITGPCLPDGLAAGAGVFLGVRGKYVAGWLFGGPLLCG